MLLITDLGELERLRDTLEQAFISDPDMFSLLVKVEKAISQELETKRLMDELSQMDGSIDDLLKETGQAARDLLKELANRG